MKSIFIRGIEDEVVAFIDRKAEELSKISGRKYTRNAYINLILKKELRDDLSLADDDKHDIINAKLDLLTEVIREDKEVTERLINLIVHGGTGDDE